MARKKIFELIKSRRNVIYLITLVLIAVLSHIEWFNFKSTLTYADYWFRFSDTLRISDSMALWMANNGAGAPNIEPYKIFFTSIQAFLASVGMDFTDIVRITHLIPIALLGFLAPYFLIKHFVKDRDVAFVGALFYGATTPFIIRQHLGHLSIAFVVAAAPLFFLFLLKALKKNRLREWLSFTALYFIGICYEMRIMYIVSIPLVGYFIFFPFFSIRNYIKYAGLTIFLLFLLSSFWILPFLQGGLFSAIENTASRALFGNSHFSLSMSLAMFHHSWTGGYPLLFKPQSIPFYFWFFPLTAASFFFLQKRKEDKKLFSFFAALYLVGLFLTKQVGAPFPNVFQWLRDHVPGFIVFRSGSKFYFVLSLGYLGVLSYGLRSLKENYSSGKGKTAFLFISFLIIGLSCLNLAPAFSKKIGGTFVNRTLPSDYKVLKEWREGSETFSRILWVPVDSRWGFYDDNSPKINYAAALEANWAEIFPRQWDGRKMSQITRMLIGFDQKFSDNLLDSTSVQYVIVPLSDKENDDEFFQYYGGSRDVFVRRLDSLAYLKKIDIGTKELAVYENEDYRPHFYSTNEQESIHRDIPYEGINFVAENQTEYKIALKDAKVPIYLNFSESFHPDWKVRVGDLKWYEVFSGKDYFLPDQFHARNDAGLNSFYIDAEYIRKKYPGAYHVNADGSIDLELTVYFKPQSYLYLGLIISGTTFLGVIGYLLFPLLRKGTAALKRKIEQFHA